MYRTGAVALDRAYFFHPRLLSSRGRTLVGSPLRFDAALSLRGAIRRTQVLRHACGETSPTDVCIDSMWVGFGPTWVGDSTNQV